MRIVFLLGLGFVTFVIRIVLGLLLVVLVVALGVRWRGLVGFALAQLVQFDIVVHKLSVFVVHVSDGSLSLPSRPPWSRSGLRFLKQCWVIRKLVHERGIGVFVVRFLPGWNLLLILGFQNKIDQGPFGIAPVGAATPVFRIVFG